jgi:hypothetical protein
LISFRDENNEVFYPNCARTSVYFVKEINYWRNNGMAKTKVPKRPTRDEFVLEEIGNQLSEAFHEGSTIVLTIWGREEPVQGIINHMDSRTGKVHVETAAGTDKVPFMDIMKVDYPRY